MFFQIKLVWKIWVPQTFYVRTEVEVPKNQLSPKTIGGPKEIWGDKFCLIKTSFGPRYLRSQ